MFLEMWNQQVISVLLVLRRQNTVLSLEAKEQGEVTGSSLCCLYILFSNSSMEVHMTVGITYVV